MNDSRISRDQMVMEIAQVVSHRSTCCRLHVGAVIAREGRILAIGYNGAPRGLPHCYPTTCNLTLDHCERSIHAELNAILTAARFGTSVEGAELFSTHSPCEKCFGAILNAGITRIVFQQAYGNELKETAELGGWTQQQNRPNFHEWSSQKVPGRW